MNRHAPLYRWATLTTVVCILADARRPAAKRHISIECTDVIATAMKPSDAPAESN